VNILDGMVHNIDSIYYYDVKTAHLIQCGNVECEESAFR
jgi:hypothetical protein